MIGMVFLWVGSNNGLNRYDGYTFKTYYHDLNDTTSIIGNDVVQVYESVEGEIWLGTYGKGFCKYDKTKDLFIRFPYLSEQIIVKFFEDSSQKMWVFGESQIGFFDKNTATFHEVTSKINLHGLQEVCQASNKNQVWLGTDSGLYLFDLDNLNLKKFIQGKQQEDTLSAQNVSALYLDQKQVLWIGYYDKGKLDQLNTSSQQVQRIFHHQDGIFTIPNYTVSAFLESGDYMWIGTQNGGISIYNKKNDTFKPLVYQKYDTYGLNSNSIAVEQGFYKDTQGRIWITTHFGGLNILDPYMFLFETMTSFLPDLTVNKVIKDSKGNLWVGTENGVVKVMPSGDYKVYVQHPILSIEEDTKGRIWVGTWANGIFCYQPEIDDFKQFLREERGFNNVYALLAHQKNLWVISHGGLSKINIDKIDGFDDYLLPCDEELLGNAENVNLIENKLWISTSKGLRVFDLQTEKIDCYIQNPDDPKGLSSNYITNVTKDQKGRYWIGTKEGLNLKIGDNTFQHISEGNGLPSDAICGVLEDGKGNLWIATKKGISKFNPDQNTFKNYNATDGLQSNQFRRNSYFKDKNGVFYMGGFKGLNVFHPDSIRDNPNLPTVYITNLKVHNKEISIGDDDSLLTQNIIYTKEITFNSEQSAFTLNFVALNFTNPSKNQYAFKLEGFDKDWNYVGTKREATYTNLDPGTYTFLVKASNNDGLWNEKPTQLIIHILPPWWQTWWFRILVISVIIIGAYSFYYIRTNFLKKQNIKLEQEVVKRTEEIATQNEELLQNQEEILSQRDFIEKQKKNLEHQNLRIKNSIKAALTIQDALLPQQTKIQQLIDDFYVIFRPKDIVSGDFYWIEKLGHQVIIAVADCTGHGVPGAFMSLIGNNLLDKIVLQQKTSSPAQILTLLHEQVGLSLNQKHAQNNNGMDIGILVMEQGNNTNLQFTYAGAKRPLYFIDSEKQELDIQEIKGARKAIGGIQNDSVKFENHKFELAKNSFIYLSSDGLTDQNNIKRKRLGKKAVFKVLKDTHHKSLSIQKKALLSLLDQHMEGTEQRDDILWLGVKV